MINKYLKTKNIFLKSNTYSKVLLWAGLSLNLACQEQATDSVTSQTSKQSKSQSSQSNDQTQQKSLAQVPQDQSPIIAQVGEVAITEADLQRRLNDLSPITRARYTNPARRQELLTSIVRFELLAAEAKRQGHDQHPEVKLTYKQAMVRELLSHEVRDLVKMSDISEEEIKEYYQAHLSDYERPELTRAAQVLFKTQAEANVALKQLQLQITARPQDARVLFGDLASEKSIDQETRARRGDLQYFTQEGKGHGERRFPQSPVPHEIAKRAFEMTQVGEISSEPIQSAKGWHLIQRTGGKRAFKRPLSEVRTEIRNLLFRTRKAKALEEYVEQLKKRSQVEINLERLNAIELAAPGAEGAEGMAPQNIRQPALPRIPSELNQLLNPSNAQ